MESGVVIAIIPVAIILWVIFFYNGMINKRNRAEQAFSTIDVMLKQRCDLVPNLVATVQQYMQHESGTLTKITELRARATDPAVPMNERVEANNTLGKAIQGLMVQVESYPQLRASENFSQLERSLNEVEAQIAASRRSYNAAVTEYNTAVEMFPNNILAGFFHFRRQNVLEISAEDRRVPDVKRLFKS